MGNISDYLAGNFGNIAVLFTAIAAIVYATKELLTKKQAKSEYLKSFEHTILN